MTRIVIGQTDHLAFASAVGGDLLVTPHSLNRLRGRVVTSICYSPSAASMTAAQRGQVAAAIALTLAPLSRVHADELDASLARWIDSAPKKKPTLTEALAAERREADICGAYGTDTDAEYRKARRRTDKAARKLLRKVERLEREIAYAHRAGYEGAICSIYPSADADPEVLAEFMASYEAPKETGR